MWVLSATVYESPLNTFHRQGKELIAWAPKKIGGVGRKEKQEEEEKKRRRK